MEQGNHGSVMKNLRLLKENLGKILLEDRIGIKHLTVAVRALGKLRERESENDRRTS